jgi:hypothetical protein
MAEEISGLLIDEAGRHKRIAIDPALLEQQVLEALEAPAFRVDRGRGIALLTGPRRNRSADFGLAATIIAHHLGHRTVVFGKSLMLGVDEANQLASLTEEQASGVANVFRSPVDDALAARVARTVVSDRRARASLLAHDASGESAKLGARRRKPESELGI